MRYYNNEVKILKSPEKDFKENVFFNSFVIDIIEEQHNIKIKKIMRNKLIQVGNCRPIEFDVLLFGETPVGKKRIFNFELKENVLHSVISQAEIRRPLVDYSYVIINLHPHTLFEMLIDTKLGNEMVMNKIGLISVWFQGRVPMLLFSSRYKKREIDWWFE